MSLLIVALLGLSAVAFPYSSNQATFALFAEQALRGDVLYRDLIDLKQPGIFAFFGAAQLPFGRSPIGVHLVELLCWLGFARWMQIELRSWFRSSRVAGSAPIAVVGTYYVTAGSRDLTQPDVLVSIPLLVAVVLGTTATAHDTRRWMRAGVATTLVALLKLPYAVIPVVVWLPNVVRLMRLETRRFLHRTVPMTSAAVAITLAPFALYAVLTGVVDDLWTLWFDWATARTELWPRDRDRLVAVVRRGVRIAAPFGLLFVAGAAVAGRRSINRTSGSLLMWFALAVPLFGAQLWFGYHLYLFLVPVTLLGWLGLDTLVAGLDGDRRRVALGGLVVAALVGVSQLGPDLIDRARLLGEHRLALTTQDRDGFRIAIDPSHSLALDHQRWVDAEAIGGDGWALGVGVDVLHVSGQDHALPIIGFAPLLLRPEDWALVDRHLVDDPPDSIAVADGARADLDRRSPTTARILAERFCRAERLEGIDLLRPGDDC